MGKYKQVETIISSLEKIIDSMKLNVFGLEELENVKEATKELNIFFYHVEEINIQKKYDMRIATEYSLYIKELEELVQIWKKTICQRRKNKVDATFWEIYEYFKYVNVENIYQSVVQHFLRLPEAYRRQYVGLSSSYQFLKATFDYTQNDYSLIRQHVELVAGSIERFRWLYEHLQDYRSKSVLNGILQYWFSFEFHYLEAINETIFLDYYDLDILECDSNTVMVDLGAFSGDSALDFVNTYKEFKKIYAYEITPSTYKVLVENVAEYKNIFPINKGVADVCKTMYVSGQEYGAANCLVNSDGEISIEVVTLDVDIKEPIDVIKMDIEGAEKDALMGAKRHIKEDRPKLLISAYHMPEDIIEIPELIYSIRDDYKFYLRYNGGRQIWPSDYILFAV